MNDFLKNVPTGNLMHWDLPEECPDCQGNMGFETEIVNNISFQMRAKCKTCGHVRRYDAKAGRK